MRISPKMEARYAKTVREKREWFLMRLDRIEKRYQTNDLRTFMDDLVRRSLSTRFPQTPQDRHEIAIYRDVSSLLQEAALARGSIEAGDVSNNQHFRHVQEIDEKLSFLKMRKIVLQRNASAAAAAKRKDGSEQRRDTVRDAIEQRKRDFPNESYALLRKFITEKCELQKDTARRYFKSLGYLPPD